MTQGNTWAAKLNREQLYDACWIMGNSQITIELIQNNPYYSFLPIRFYNYGDWNYKEQYDLHSVGTYRDGFELCRDSDICSAKAFYAQRVWERGAKAVLEHYPDIEDCSIGEQKEDGIYPISFKYDIEEIANYQRNAMKCIIEDGFSIDEYLNMDYYIDGHRKNWFYSGVVGESYDEMYDLFYSTPHGEMPPVEIKHNVSFSYEECEKYYKTFDKRMLELGNQRRAYEFLAGRNNRLFISAEKADIPKLKELVRHGFSINEINQEGETAFSMIVSTLTKDHYLSDMDEAILDELIEYGANVNLIGVTPNSDYLILDAYCNGDTKLFKWLLRNGADLDMEIFFEGDRYESYTIRDWVEEHETHESDD